VTIEQCSWGPILALGLAVALALGAFLLNLPVKGPMIQADEGSYLANAAAIAGFPNDMASSYHAGYSFLIAPAFRLARCAPGGEPPGVLRMGKVDHGRRGVQSKGEWNSVESGLQVPGGAGGPQGRGEKTEAQGRR